MSARAAAALLALAAALAGCGLKGPLYLPEKSQEIVIRPGAGTAPGAATETGTEAAPPPAPQPTPPSATPEEAPPPPAPDASQTRPPGSVRG